ncbi:ABC transporter permease subunit [Comamonas sp. JC664]|uniref:ABC transporter permease n=1 Tax=Comamonas sp. JC664 TaxID=2801917 RepID=UPI00174ECB44|nr:ABC transporter permease subunit [Comamonas sp. JC664]MBL0699082.1 ABC transporter permease [Comamonas sp. JC664]GHG80379.1 Na+ ABC transporter permease [Comamonas sp. KCTC 72670]
MMRLSFSVFRKELRDHLRDHRSVLTSLMWPLIGPVVFLVMFNMLASWYRQDRPLQLPVVGREHAPSLMAFLERYGAKLEEAPENYEERIRAGSLDAVLVVPDDYAESYSAGHTAEVQLVVDSSRQSARQSVMRARRLLEAYSQMLGNQRLYARGVVPELAMPVRVAETDLSTPERTAAGMLNTVPLFLVIAAFAGGMQVASDTMAGERERGSLEPLLLNPVPRSAVVTGKWLSTLAMAVAAVVMTLVGYLLVVQRVPLEDLGVKARFDAPAALGMAAAVLPLALAASAVQVWVSTYARSFKEAQTYLSLLMFVPMLPGMVLALSPLQPKLWMFFVPVFGQELLAGEVMRGEPLGVLPFLITAASSVVVTVLALAVTTRLLTRERIVFGRG